MARALEIKETLVEGEHVLALVGCVDTNTAPQLEAVAARIYAIDAAPRIVVDLAECTFLSSAGLRVIVTMQKRATRGGSLRFCNVTPSIREVFDSTGFSKILTVA